MVSLISVTVLTIHAIIALPGPPSAAPTFAVGVSASCEQSCALQIDDATPIATGHALTYTYLPPRYFTLSFDVYNPALSAGSGVLSLLQLWDSNESRNFLHVGTTSTRRLAVGFSSQAVVTVDAELVSSFAAEWTTITVVFRISSIDVFTSTDPDQISTVACGFFEMQTTFALYASGPTGTSAGGYIRNVEITGKACSNF
jgi:hypothetical protein